MLQTGGGDNQQQQARPQAAAAATATATPIPVSITPAGQMVQVVSSASGQPGLAHAIMTHQGLAALQPQAAQLQAIAGHLQQPQQFIVNVSYKGVQSQNGLYPVYVILILINIFIETGGN